MKKGAVITASALIAVGMGIMFLCYRKAKKMV